MRATRTGCSRSCSSASSISNPKKNPWFDHAEVGYWLAFRGERPVGRISAQVDHLHLERYGDATGHFGFLDAEDDAEVFEALFEAAEDWLKARGMRRVTGPFSLSINDESGLLVEGFETPPYMMMGHAPRYYGPTGRGAGLSDREEPDRLHLPTHGTFAPRQAHARSPQPGRRAQLPADRHAPLRRGAPDSSSTSSTTPGRTIGASCP